MKRIAIIVMFSIFAIAGLYMAATSERTAVAFVYVLLTMGCTFLVGYFTFENKSLL